MSDRKVRFKEPIHQVEYMNLDEELDLDGLCRSGDVWRLACVDRFRFENRTNLIAEKISWIFDSTHRKRIFEQRFQDEKLSSREQQQQQQHNHPSPPQQQQQHNLKQPQLSSQQQQQQQQTEFNQEQRTEHSKTTEISLDLQADNTKDIVNQE